MLTICSFVSTFKKRSIKERRGTTVKNVISGNVDDELGGGDERKMKEGSEVKKYLTLSLMEMNSLKGFSFIF
jgi:hypothetical protein